MKIKFTEAQIAFVAEQILVTCYMQIDSLVRSGVHEMQEATTDVDFQAAVDAIQEMAAATLSVLFAQTTGEGMGVYDWSGVPEFTTAIDSLIGYYARRYASDCDGNLPDAVERQFHRECAVAATRFAAEWAQVQQAAGRLDNLQEDLDRFKLVERSGGLAHGNYALFETSYGSVAGQVVLITPQEFVVYEAHGAERSDEPFETYVRGNPRGCSFPELLRDARLFEVQPVIVQRSNVLFILPLSQELWQEAFPLGQLVEVPVPQD